MNVIVSGASAVFLFFLVLCPSTSVCFMLCWVNLADLSLNRLPRTNLIFFYHSRHFEKHSEKLLLTFMKAHNNAAVTHR